MSNKRQRVSFDRNGLLHPANFRTILQISPHNPSNPLHNPSNPAHNPSTILHNPSNIQPG
jgi:hypothetical protein